MDGVLFSHNSDEWCTPPDLFARLDEEFHFTLDPCSTADNHLCARYFTKSQDGLLQDWSNDVVFCNPPYSRVKDWVKKAFDSTCLSVLLVPARTDTVWFHDYCLSERCHVRFIRGRLKFSGSKNSAPFPSMLVIFNPLFCYE